MASLLICIAQTVMYRKDIRLVISVLKLLEYYKHIHQYQASQVPDSPTIVAVVQPSPVCHALSSSVHQLVTARDRTYVLNTRQVIICSNRTYKCFLIRVIFYTLISRKTQIRFPPKNNAICCYRFKSLLYFSALKE